MDAKTKVVLHFGDGRVLKGHIYDFTPGKQRFHLACGPDDTEIVDVTTSDLKAIFYVKSFEGDPAHAKHNGYTPEQLAAIPGLKLKITFKDGEELYGTTTGWSRERPGFFLVPLDKNGNNERIYVVSGSTRSVTPIR